MSVIDNVVVAMTKSKGPAATVSRADLEKVVALARIGEAFRQDDAGCDNKCIAIDCGFQGDCEECQISNTCGQLEEYKNLVLEGASYDNA